MATIKIFLSLSERLAQERGVRSEERVIEERKNTVLQIPTLQTCKCQYYNIYIVLYNKLGKSSLTHFACCYVSKLLIVYDLKRCFELITLT